MIYILQNTCALSKLFTPNSYIFVFVLYNGMFKEDEMIDSYKCFIMSMKFELIL